MVMVKCEENAEIDTTSAQAALSEKKTSKSLKLKAKKMKRSMKQRLQKSKEAGGASVGQSANKDKSWTPAKGKGFSKGGQNSKNKFEKLEPKQVDAPKFEGEVGGGSLSQIQDKDKNKNRTPVVKTINQNKSKKGKVKGNLNKKNKDKKDKSTSGEASNSERKLGGVIFMCNSKTKTECFAYKILGLPYSKKKVGLGIKTGLKLFLYDVDLKLLFGVFEATCDGGIKLEPAAFGGALPVQVHFRIFKECLPIPESVFRNAIKANYDERKNKFNSELSSTQARKLRSLFRPIRQPHMQDQLPVSLQPIPSFDPLYVTEEEYRSYGLRPGLQDTVPYLSLSMPVLFPESYGTGLEQQVFKSPAQRYKDTSSTQDQIFRVAAQPYEDVSVVQDMFGKSTQVRGLLPSFQDPPVGSESFFLSENKHRMYGLRGQSVHSSLLPATTRPTQLGSYQGNEYRSHNTNYANSYGPYSSLTGGDFSTYGSCSQSTVTEAYCSDLRSLSSSVDYNLPRRVADEGLYTSSYISRDRNEYNHGSHVGGQSEFSSAVVSSYISRDQDEYNNRNHVGGQSEFSSAPVSSKYSFAGAMYSLR